MKNATRITCAVVVIALIGPAAGASAHFERAAAASAPSDCGGAPDPSLTPSSVITGEFDTSREGSYVLLRSRCPRARPRYASAIATTSPRRRPTPASSTCSTSVSTTHGRVPGALWGEAEFRGWGGSSHPDVTVSPNGFSTEAEYLANPRLHRHGSTTRGFEPGPIQAGEWAVELGVAAVASQAEGDSDGKVAWRVQVDVSSDSSWSDRPVPAGAVQHRSGASHAGWYAGDFHVHAEHSSLGDATMRETFDYAFRPLAAGGAGLDFITLSDYVSDTAWGEIGRYQPDYPGRLIARSAEIITYRGHANNHATARYVDYRTGPVYERMVDGSFGLAARRGRRARSSTAFTTPGASRRSTIRRSSPPPCPASTSSAAAAPGTTRTARPTTRRSMRSRCHRAGRPSSRTPSRARIRSRRRRSSSRSTRSMRAAQQQPHRRGRLQRLAQCRSHAGPGDQAPIGTATTVVYADELSEQGIARGVKAGHTYVKVFGNDGPDLRFDGAPRPAPRRDHGRHDPRGRRRA